MLKAGITKSSLVMKRNSYNRELEAIEFKVGVLVSRIMKQQVGKKRVGKKFLAPRFDAIIIGGFYFAGSRELLSF